MEHRNQCCSFVADSDNFDGLTLECKQISNFCLYFHFQRVIDVDSKVSHYAFVFVVTEANLNCLRVLCEDEFKDVFVHGIVCVPSVIKFKPIVVTQVSYV